MPNKPEDSLHLSVCTIILHDSQEIIDAFKSNRTVIVNDPTGSKLFPLVFGFEGDTALLELPQNYVFQYDDSVCNYFGYVD